MLKDIFNSLCAAVDGDEEKVCKLESIGFLHAGVFSMTFFIQSQFGQHLTVYFRTHDVTIDSPAGYVVFYVQNYLKFLHRLPNSAR